VKLKKTPGAYIQDAFSKGNSLQNIVKNPSLLKQLTITEEEKKDTVKESSAIGNGGFMESFKNKGIIGNWRNFKNTVKNTI